VQLLLEATEEDNSADKDTLKNPAVSSPTEASDENIIHINRIEPEAFTIEQPYKSKPPQTPS
jgi:hypothetical protein